MKALILYDNLEAALKASATLQRAAYPAQAGLQWRIKPWRVDLLRLPLVGDEALREAVDADLIAFTGSWTSSLPAWLEEWLERWAKQRQVTNAALAVIPHGTDRERSAPATLELSRFATRHDLDLITD
jgi:hypothetical protein